MNARCDGNRIWMVLKERAERLPSNTKDMKKNISLLILAPFLISVFAPFDGAFAAGQGAGGGGGNGGGTGGGSGGAGGGGISSLAVSNTVGVVAPSGTLLQDRDQDRLRLQIHVTSTATTTTSTSSLPTSTSVGGGDQLRDRDRIQDQQRLQDGSGLGSQNQYQVQNQYQAQNSTATPGQNQGQGYGYQFMNQEQAAQGTGTLMQIKAQVQTAARALIQAGANATTSGLGDQIRTIAQNQVENQARIQSSIEKIQQRPGLAKLFIGPNYGEVNNAQRLITENTQQIRQLEQIAAQVSNGGDQQAIATQVQNLQEANNRLGNSLDEARSGFSFFGWLFQLFG